MQDDPVRGSVMADQFDPAIRESTSSRNGADRWSRTGLAKHLGEGVHRISRRKDMDKLNSDSNMALWRIGATAMET